MRMQGTYVTKPNKSNQFFLYIKKKLKPLTKKKPKKFYGVYKSKHESGRDPIRWKRLKRKRGREREKRRSQRIKDSATG